MRQFRSLRRVMGGFMPPEQAIEVKDVEAESVRLIKVLGRIIISRLADMEKKMADQNVTTWMILDAVKAQRGAIASLSLLLGGIKERLNQSLQGEISPKGQAMLNDIMSEIQGNSRAITDAIATNDDDPNTVASDGTGGALTGNAGSTGGISDPAHTGVGSNGPAETGKAATTTTLSTSKAVAASGETISLSAGVSVDGNGPVDALTGTVTFASEEGEIGKAGLDSTGVAAMSIADLPPGDHSITATYGGDDNYASSTSQSLTQTVMPKADQTQQQGGGQSQVDQQQQG